MRRRQRTNASSLYQTGETLQQSEFPVQEREKIEGKGDQGPSMMLMAKLGSLKDHRILKVLYTYSGTRGHG